MNRCVYQQKTFGFGEMMSGDVSVSHGVVCPKPRRLGLCNSSFVHVDETIRPHRLLQIINQRAEDCDLRAETELLDIILTKGSSNGEKSNFEVASSPPYFCGSPPRRAANPLIQDAQFGNGNFVPILPTPEVVAPLVPLPPPLFSASGRKNGGGCVPVMYSNKPAPVRIEGFNCRRNSSISAFA